MDGDEVGAAVCILHAAAVAGGRRLVLAVVGDLAAHQQVALAVPLGPTFDKTYEYISAYIYLGQVA